MHYLGIELQPKIQTQNFAFFLTEAIRKANLGKKVSVEVKQKISLNSKVAKAVLLTNNDTKEILEFTSVLAASKFTGISNSQLDRCLKSNKPCKGYTIIFKQDIPPAAQLAGGGDSLLGNQKIGG